ncbi:MAG: RloB family protein [Bacilli bacterium]
MYPLKLIEHEIKYINKYNHIWCVFDLDDFHKQGKIKKAYKLAKNYHNISIACSNFSFEIWLIYHY